ncbi:MAG: phospho-N-acetylmuramoyl-pentapeptide-transferase [Propionicimonas sp.]|jgi:phospho-N-acetylmuramoyl-pentapeptide-transferase
MRTVLFAGGVALLVTLLGTRYMIRFLIRQNYGQFIRDDGPTTHHTKRGTPTMGGIVIIGAALIGYAVAHLITWSPPTASALLVLGLVTALGVVGFLDDWIKISRARSLGLHSTAKLALQTTIAVGFGVLSFMFPNERGLTPASPAISFLRDFNWSWLHLPIPLAVIWIVLLISSWSNAANLTDGLDGLASGAATMVFAAYTIINVWQYNQSCAYLNNAGPTCYEVRDPLDLAAVSIALAAACFGFLWWNAAPAKIFMGDTGSLAIGGGLAALSIFTRTELLMLIVGGLFFVITMSVVLQVGWFKLSKGKRLFKMAPLHHHFELLGWSQITVTVRFWIICGVFVALGIGLFYAEWVVGT